LVRDAHIPIVMTEVDEKVWAWTNRGRFEMPDQAGEIFSPDHPHLPHVARDFTKLCFHRDGGNFVICGWQNDATPVTFVLENGAHGGPGPNETSGFFVVPADAPFPDPENGIIRPLTLRRMAQRVLHRTSAHRADSYRNRPENVVRLATYNVHSCIGLDGRLSPSRIARVLATASPDIVALQEIDVLHDRSRFVHQAEKIARALNMELHFHPSFEVEEGQYGNAILSRFPLEVMRAGPLPALDKRQQPRGALWVQVDVGGRPLQVLTTHLGLSSTERALQVEELLGQEWLDHPDCREPFVVCGDMNMLPGSKAYRRMTARLRDVQKSIERYQPQRTWFAPFPLTRIDHVFVGESLRVMQIDIPRTRLSRVASDHLPLVVDLELPPAENATRRRGETEKRREEERARG
jgi:endonuclease/exonuclease/phosphatase family metal-dependent hydrolase